MDHKTKSGKIVKGKVFCEQTECGCKNKCAIFFCITRQKEIFDTFYSLKNKTQKTLYLRSLVRSHPKKENLKSMTTANQKRKYEYYLTNNCGKQKEVCSRFFLKCLQISTDSLYRAIRSVISNESAVELRGRFPNKKTSQSDFNFVKQFIGKFPCYHSHYGPSKSEKQFLHPNLNIKRLYREYSIVCEFEQRKILSEWKFRDIFNTKFNLGFHPKKVDTCRTCDKLEAQLTADNAINRNKEFSLKQKQYHLRLVDNTNDKFQNTIKCARDDSKNTEVLTFDLQRALELPSISTSEAFYRRQLWCYNLCVFDERRKKAYMYFWNESIASRGAQEISSCLIKHFSNFVPTNTVKIILYSDACPGQNRNIKTTIMMKKFLDSCPNSELKSIEQRFFVSGHSFNSCDRCFGLIERQKRQTELIHVPQHWINIIEQSKKRDPQFTLVEMKRGDFLSSEKLEAAITNRKKSLDDEKINWFKIQRIVNVRSNPLEMLIENYCTCSNPFIRVSLRKKGKNIGLSTFSEVNFEPLYTESRKITRQKYADLQKLMEFIPDQFQWFYTSLKYDGDTDNEPKESVQKSKEFK